MIKNKANLYMNISVFSIPVIFLLLSTFILSILYGRFDFLFLQQILLINMLFSLFFIITLFVIYARSSKKKGNHIIPTHYNISESGIHIKLSKNSEDMIKWDEVEDIKVKFFKKMIFLYINRKVNSNFNERIESDYGDIILFNNNEYLNSFLNQNGPRNFRGRTKRSFPFFQMRYNQFNDQVFSYKNEYYRTRLMNLLFILLFNVIILAVVVLLGGIIGIVLCAGVAVFTTIMIIKERKKIPTSINIKKDRLEAEYVNRMESYFLGDFDFFYYDTSTFYITKNKQIIKKIDFINKDLEVNLDYIYRYFQ